MRRSERTTADRRGWPQRTQRTQQGRTKRADIDFYLLAFSLSSCCVFCVFCGHCLLLGGWFPVLIAVVRMRRVAIPVVLSQGSSRNGRVRIMRARLWGVGLVVGVSLGLAPMASAGEAEEPIVSIELRLLSLSPQCYRQLNLADGRGSEIHPGVNLLDDAQMRILLEKVQEDSDSGVMQAPRLNVPANKKAL